MIVQDSASSEMREIRLGCFYQPDSSSLSSLSSVASSTDEHRPPLDHLRTTCSEKHIDVPATLQASKIPMPLEIYAPYTCITTDFEQQNLCYVQYMIVVFACPVSGCMGNILLCHEG